MTPVHVRPDAAVLCREVAARIAQLVRDKPDCVLGLATGSTPIGVYAELARLHRDEGLDFARVRCFNLDEFYPMQPEAAQAFGRFMRVQLFDHINCPPENWHVPDGTLRSPEQIERDCDDYEAMIQDAGGLDLQLLGIGRTGHIGFNEPGSASDSRTRLVTLDHLTRADAAAAFFGIENVPVRAITMGIGTILDAREIILMATGARKAAIIAQAVEGKITSKVPASFGREHSNASFWLDEAAASELKQFAEPWRESDADLSRFALRRRALIAVSRAADKPLGKIAPHDLSEAGIGRLLGAVPSLEAALQEVERDLHDKMRDDHLPQGQGVLCLSPHPDDDVICCGATLLKLKERGNQITVAYGVSGANAVRDKDVLAALRSGHPRLMAYLNAHEPLSQAEAFDELRHFIFEREPGAPDSPLLRNLKRLVRQGEASDACRKMGARALFLDLPFYYDAHGTIGAQDVEMMQAALDDVRPDLVLLTTEMNDPHATHEKCFEVFERAAAEYRGPAFGRWGYRGAWDEFQVWEGDHFCVFGKDLMERKIGLILDHISQLEPMFPGGSDPREFYERARDRNRATARQLQQLGVLPPSRSFDPLYAEVFRVLAAG